MSILDLDKDLLVAEISSRLDLPSRLSLALSSKTLSNNLFQQVKNEIVDLWEYPRENHFIRAIICPLLERDNYTLALEFLEIFGQCFYLFPITEGFHILRICLKKINLKMFREFAVRLGLKFVSLIDSDLLPSLGASGDLGFVEEVLKLFDLDIKKNDVMSVMCEIVRGAAEAGRVALILQLLNSLDMFDANAQLPTRLHAFSFNIECLRDVCSQIQYEGIASRVSYNDDMTVADVLLYHLLFAVIIQGDIETLRGYFESSGVDELDLGVLLNQSFFPDIVESEQWSTKPVEDRIAIFEFFYNLCEVFPPLTKDVEMIPSFLSAIGGIDDASMLFPNLIATGNLELLSDVMTGKFAAGGLDKVEFLKAFEQSKPSYLINAIMSGSIPMLEVILGHFDSFENFNLVLEVAMVDLILGYAHVNVTSSKRVAASKVMRFLTTKVNPITYLSSWRECEDILLREDGLDYNADFLSFLKHFGFQIEKIFEREINIGRLTRRGFEWMRSNYPDLLTEDSVHYVAFEENSYVLKQLLNMHPAATELVSFDFRHMILNGHLSTLEVLYRKAPKLLRSASHEIQDAFERIDVEYRTHIARSIFFPVWEWFSDRDFKIANPYIPSTLSISIALVEGRDSSSSDKTFAPTVKNPILRTYLYSLAKKAPLGYSSELPEPLVAASSFSFPIESVNKQSQSQHQSFNSSEIKPSFSFENGNGSHSFGMNLGMTSADPFSASIVDKQSETDFLGLQPTSSPSSSNSSASKKSAKPKSAKKPPSKDFDFDDPFNTS